MSNLRSSCCHDQVRFEPELIRYGSYMEPWRGVLQKYDKYPDDWAVCVKCKKTNIPYLPKDETKS